MATSTTTITKAEIRNRLGRGAFTILAFAVHFDLSNTKAREVVLGLVEDGVLERRGELKEDGRRGRPPHLFRLA